MADSNIANIHFDFFKKRQSVLSDVEGYSVNTKSHTSPFLNMQINNLEMDFNQMSEMSSSNEALQNPYTTLVASNRLVTFPTFKVKRRSNEDKGPSKSVEITNSGTKDDDRVTFHPAVSSNTAGDIPTKAFAPAHAPFPTLAPAPASTPSPAPAPQPSPQGGTRAQKIAQGSATANANPQTNLAASTSGTGAPETSTEEVIYPITEKAMAQINAAADGAVAKVAAAGGSAEQQQRVREQTIASGREQFQKQMAAAKAKAKAKAMAAKAKASLGLTTAGGGGGGDDGTGAGAGMAAGAAVAANKPQAAPAASPAKPVNAGVKQSSTNTNPAMTGLQLTKETLPSFVLTPVPPGTVFQCSILRSKSGLFPRFDLFIESENLFLLAAKREGKFNYLMSTVATDVSKTSQYYAGKVKRMVVTNTFIVYGAGKGFKHLKEGEVAKREQLREEMAFISLPEVEAGVRTICTWVPPVTEAGVRQALRPIKPTESISNVKEFSPASLVQLISRKPTLNPVTKKYQMDFRGRAKMASIKNQQMVLGSNPNLTLQESPNILQFGKITDNRFSLDFSWPLCPLQAFALALVIFDIG